MNVSVKRTNYNKLKPKTAILIFAQNASKESKTKTFMHSELLFDELNKQVLDKVIKSGLHYFQHSEQEQIGENFAERYINAIQYVYDQGYDAVITIGNDTPQLKTHHLLDAAKNLQENKIVLGPSLDGGYYLLGLHKSQFNKDLFLQLPWQTSRLLQKVKHLFGGQNAKVYLLNKLNDLDGLKDLKKLVNGFVKLQDSLIKILVLILFTKTSFNTKTLSFISTQDKDIYYNKGSTCYL